MEFFRKIGRFFKSLFCCTGGDEVQRQHEVREDEQGMQSTALLLLAECCNVPV